MKKLVAVALLVTFMATPVLVSCSEKENPDKKGTTTTQKEAPKVPKDSLKPAPGWKWIPYEPIPF